MRITNRLLRAQKAKDNEFYTDYSTMQYLFEGEEHKDQFRSFVKNKVVYLPCDADWSNIYKYFVDHQEELEIKEILHTSDDYYSHLDLYEKADLVFTNPPFTRLRKYVEWLIEMNKEFVLWWSWQSLAFLRKGAELFFDKKVRALNHYREKGPILCWNADRTKFCATFLFTNIKSVTEHSCLPMPEFTYDVKDLPKYEGIPYANRMKKFPKDYYGEIIIPIISAFYRIEHFDFVRFLYVLDDDEKWRPRVIVKRKQ